MHIVTPVTISGCAFCEDIFDSFVGTFNLAVSLGVVCGCFDVSDVVGVGEDCEEFIDEFCALISGEDFWNSMSTDDIFMEK